MKIYSSFHFHWPLSKQALSSSYTTIIIVWVWVWVWVVNVSGLNEKQRTSDKNCFRTLRYGFMLDPFRVTKCCIVEQSECWLLITKLPKTQNACEILGTRIHFYYVAFFVFGDPKAFPFITCLKIFRNIIVKAIITLFKR